MATKIYKDWQENKAKKAKLEQAAKDAMYDKRKERLGKYLDVFILKLEFPIRLTEKVRTELELHYVEWLEIHDMIREYLSKYDDDDYNFHVRRYRDEESKENITFIEPGPKIV
jgi:hypothetical protein